MPVDPRKGEDVSKAMQGQHSSRTNRDDPVVREKLLGALKAIEADDFAAAIEVAETVLEETPDHAVGLHLLGLLAVRLNEPGRAIELFKAAHESDPDCREHCDALAIIYAKVGNLRDSLYHGKLATVLVASPTYPGLLPEWLGSFESNFMDIEESPLLSAGDALTKAGRFLDAAHHYRNAAELDAKDAQAWRGLANALRRGGRPIEADVAFQALISLCPDNPDDLTAMAQNLTGMGAFEEAQAAHGQAIALDELRSEPYSAMLYDRRFDPAYAAASVAAAEAAWGQVFAFDPMPRVERPPESAPRKLRLGIVSGRFRADTPLELFWSMLSHCASSSVSVYCYNNNPFNDVATRRLQGYVEGWVDIREVDDETVATIIRNDGIDVLLDMDGHCEDGRPQVFTLRPAVTALRCWGLPDAALPQGFDGVLGDGVVYGETAEHVLRVDGGLLPLPQTQEPHADEPQARDAFCFGTLALRAQMTGNVIDAWVEILSRCSATLLINPDWLGGVEIANEIKRAFDARGCGERVMLHSLTKEQSTDARRYIEAVDAMLEPFPMPSLERIWDALRHCRPVVCMKSDFPESRIVPSLLTQMGLSELVADDADGYVATAVALAEDPARLRAQRDRIARGLSGEIKHLSPKARLDALANSLIAHYRSVV